MESTAIGFYHAVAIFALDWIRGKDNVDAALVVANIKKMIHEIHTFTSWHYTKGSVYDTPFWRSAQVQTSAMFEQPDELFQNIVDLAKITDYVDVDITFKGRYGLWPAASIKRWYDGYINK